jgi:hypothetical protein
VSTDEEMMASGPTWAWDCNTTGRKYTITFGAVEEIFDGAPSAAIWYSNPKKPEDHNEQPVLIPIAMVLEAMAEVFDPDLLIEFFKQHVPED